MIELETFFCQVRDMVDDTLDKLVPAAAAEPTQLHEAIRWSLFGSGKRFRPAILIAAGRLFGACDEALLRTAAAVEMIHTYSLIHDDLPAMDDDDLRRGRATAHKKFGEATAILAGDALQAMAFETIAADEALEESLRLQLITELSVAAGRMVSGQQLDLEAEGKDLDLESIKKIHSGKTGALIGFSVRAGGLIARANKGELDVLTQFGKKLGLLFQITDDILDVTSTSETLGKTAGKDVTDKKATYPEVLGLERARSYAKQAETETLSVLTPIDRDVDFLIEICKYVSSRRN